MKERDIDTREIEAPRLLFALAIPHEQRGSQLVAKCPFHDDSDPSWAMRDAPGDYKNGHHRCMSCGEGGGAVKLVMHVMGLSARAAVEWIVGAGLVTQAAASGIELEFVDPLERRAKARDVVMPLGFRVAPLDRWPSSVRRYAEGRGLDADQVERWGVGYAVDGALEGRIVFPVRDFDGRLRSYEARSYLGRKPKYLRPSVADGFRFGAIFGAERWPTAGRRVVVITEGVLNALACERAGAPAVAAICGSNLSGEHLLELAPRFDSFVVATDPDRAGSRVAEELFASFARRNVARIARLPSGKDCSDLDTAFLARILWRRRA